MDPKVLLRQCKEDSIPFHYWHNWVDNMITALTNKNKLSEKKSLYDRLKRIFSKKEDRKRLRD